MRGFTVRPMSLAAVRRAIVRLMHVHRVAGSNRIGVFRHDRCRCGAHRLTWLEGGVAVYASSWTATYDDALREVTRYASEAGPGAG